MYLSLFFFKFEVILEYQTYFGNNILYLVSLFYLDFNNKNNYNYKLFSHV